MLRPVETPTREIKKLDGLWAFSLDRENWFFDRGVSSFYFHFSSMGFSQITVCNTELVN